MPIRNSKLFKRPIASMLCFFMAIYPFYSFGITPDSSVDPSVVGRQGQSYGKELSNSFRFPTQNGNMIEFGDGEFIDQRDLAPKGEGFYVDDPDIDGLQGVFDSVDSMDGAGMAAQNKLYRDADKENPETLSGAAYQIVLRASDARNEFPDLTNDPIVHASGQAIFDQGLLDSFGDCSVQTDVSETTRPVNVPDPEYCTRVNLPQGGQSCKARNTIVLKGSQVTKTENLMAFPANQYHRKTYAKMFTQDLNTGVLDHLYEEVCGSGSGKNPTVTITAAYGNHSSGSRYPISINPPYWDLGERYQPFVASGTKPLSVTSNLPGLYLQQPTCANGLTVRFDSYPVSRKSRKFTIAQMHISVTYETASVVVDKDKSGWSPQSCIDRALDRKATIADTRKENIGAVFASYSPLTDMAFGEFIKPGGLNAYDGLFTQKANYDGDFCSTTATVSAGAINHTQCIKVNDNNGKEHQICPGSDLFNQLDPSPIPGIPTLAGEVTVTSDCSGFNQGPMDCFEDIHGDLQCPHNDGSNPNECKKFEENPSCSFVNSQCIEGARGDSGFCYAYEDEYDCGFTIDIPSYEKTDSYNCGGPIRCMGADCLDPMQPPSAANDFAKAAALLDAAQSMSQDMNCNPDGSGCTVFTGETKECKTAVGGMVNCCEKPKGVSLSEYITVIRAAPKFNSAMRSLADSSNPFSSVGKGYEAIADPIGSSFQSITKPIAGHVENISSAIKGMKDTAMETIDKLATKAVNTVKGAFGKGAASEGAQQASQGVVSSIMNSPAMLYLQTVMAIYTIYVIVTVIVSIVWKCTKKEFELGTQRQLKACTKVGSYCRKKVLGACVEQRQSYCCFSSPLSRIMQEQIRPQLGLNFGPAKSPDCSGIPVARFTDVDWDRVNLDEWLGILQATNNFPGTSDLNIESMTGASSNFDTGDRLNTLQRNLDRFEGVDGAAFDKARSEAAKSVPITTGRPSD